MPVRPCLSSAIALGLTLVTPAVALGSADAPTSGRDVVLAGLYSDQWESAADLEALALVSGKRVSLMGTFHHLRESEDGWEGTTGWLLEQAWMAQTTPVANVSVTAAAADVASGSFDTDMTAWGLRVKGWLDKGGGRSLLIAPMQEMNGDWVPYGMDPIGFQAAFRRFVEIFRGLGLDETRVRWVFAPNGWSIPPYKIVDYYPGDDLVDLIGVSAYNFGSDLQTWAGVYEAVGGALTELRSFAPAKPYLITQVGSSTAGGDRDTWLRELFSLAAADPNVVGLIYFNFIKETDWKVWDGVTLAAGWRDGMQLPTTVHRWPLTGWFASGPLPFAPFQGTFADDDALPAQLDIEWLVGKGITQGCDVERFCPGEAVTREQLATFVVRALGLPATTTDHFVDDNGSLHEADINALAEAGVIGGCATDHFCPTDPVTRQQLANVLVRALNLPLWTADHISDPTDPLYQVAITTLVEASIARGCNVDPLCPTAVVNREELAALLRSSFHREGPEQPPRWPGSGRSRATPL